MSSHGDKPVLHFLRELYAPRASHDLVEFILRSLPAIVDGHNNCLSRYDPARRVILQMNLQTPFTSREFLETLRHGGESLNQSLWKLLPPTRNSFHIISHHFSRCEWNNHPIYRDMFRHEGILDCMTLELGDSARRFMFCVHRDRRGFRNKEIETFRLLAPHLVQAFSNAHVFENAIPGFGSPFLRENAHIHHLGPIGHRAASQFIRGNRSRLRTLLGHEPAGEIHKLQAWIETGINHLNRGTFESALSPFDLKGETLTIRFRIMRNWSSDAHLVTEETSRNLHLTPREIEVLHWVRAGKTDREIAIILNSTHHTVKEHLRRVFRKSGTRSRTAAARLAPHPAEA